MADDTRTIFERLAAAKAKFGKVVFDSSNPHFKSRYASLASINNAVDDALVGEGFLPTWTLGSSPEGNVVTVEFVLTLLTDSSQIKSGPVGFAFADPQKAGSAITYGRRYTKAALLGLLAEDDDDANAASTPAKPKPAPAPAYNPETTPPPAAAPAPAPTASPAPDIEAEVAKFNQRQASANAGGRTPDPDETNDCDPGFPDAKGKHWKDGPSRAQIGRIYGIAKSKEMPKETWKAYIAATYGVSNPYRLDWKQYKDFTEKWMESWVSSKDIPF
jgi:hypothetical protein